MDRLDHLRVLRGALEGAALDLPTARAAAGEAARRRAVRRLGDHVLPRLEAADAPLLAVVGGSTGAGKSTLVNSLVSTVVSATSPVRPTTRRPLLLHHAADERWFLTRRVLPGLARVVVGAAVGAGGPTDTTGGSPVLEVRAVETLPEGLALVDAPDLDSVVAGNRALARQLLDAADLWVFVTTAARYADAVPWEVLADAGSRDIACAVVLDRVPPGAMDEVSADLRRLLAANGLPDAPVLGIDEQPLEASLLPAGALAPLREWLGSLCADAATRADVAARTLAGAVGEVVEGALVVADALDEHDQTIERARARLDAAVAESLERLAGATADGTLLRGEVLARWQEVVGAADLSRRLDRGVSLVRDRLGAFLRGGRPPLAPVEDALGEGLASLLREELARAREEVEDSWGADPALAGLLADVPGAEGTRLDAWALDVARDWQGDLLEMVRTQSGSRRTAARLLALGVNAAGVALMVVIFASTAGLTGAEVGVAGGTALLSQRLLEAVFGDQAVRSMTVRAHGALLERARAALGEVLAPLASALPAPSDRATVRAAVATVRGDWS